jgi:hypothetical protein
MRSNDRRAPPTSRPRESRALPQRTSSSSGNRQHSLPRRDLSVGRFLVIDDDDRPVSGVEIYGRIGLDKFFASAWPVQKQALRSCLPMGGNFMVFATSGEESTGSRLGKLSRSVISSQGSYMIGEFCPKVFALNIHRVFSLNMVEFEFGCRRVGRDRHS